MQPERLNEILLKYRANKARDCYLRCRLDELNAELEEAKLSMIMDGVSLNQAITGMPHGSGVGDPAGKLAIRLASGELIGFAKDIQDEINTVNHEIDSLKRDIRVVDIVLESLSEREREIFTLKMIDNMNWAETMSTVREKYGNVYSKRSVQRLLERAQDKAYRVVM